MIGSHTLITSAPLAWRSTLSSGEHWRNSLCKKSVYAQEKKTHHSTKEKLSNSNESCISFGKQRSLVLFIFCVKEIPALGSFFFFFLSPTPTTASLLPQLTVSLSPWLSWEVMIDGYTTTLLGGACSYYAQRPFLINSQFKPSHLCIHKYIYVYNICTYK